MANRPNNFDTTTPSGASSPRLGDDEIRKIKTYTQNAYNDLTQASGVGVTHTNLYGTIITADTFLKAPRIVLDGVNVTATGTELNVLDGVTATTDEINKLDLADGTFLGVAKVEPASEGTPDADDFSGNITFVCQY